MRALMRYASRRFRRLARDLTLRYGLDEGLVIVLAASIGALAGVAVIGFYEFLDWVRGVAGVVRATPGGVGLLVTLPLVAGGLWISHLLLRGVAGGAEMVPALIRSSVRHGGHLALGDVLRKLAAAGVTIGAGGSLGAEGPVAVAGAAVGSGSSQLFAFGQRRARVLLACGTAGGISAAFNAPIAGVLFALEVVLGTFAVGALSPVVVASVMGAVVSRRFLGDSPAFAIPTEFHFASAGELPFYALLGVVAGMLAWAFVRLFYATQDVLAGAVSSPAARALLAGSLIAALGMLHPELLGDGRRGIELVLAAELAGLAALGLGIGKVFSAGLTAGGGGAGGVFTPSLLVGASFGSFYGLTLQRVFPTLSVTPEAYALVGMAAVVAGATHAPLTAIIMVFELTDDYGLILPLMLVCVISFLISRRLTAESLYSAALARTGDRIVHGADRSALENVRVADCYERNPDVILEDAPVRGILEQIRTSKQSWFPVITREREFAGLIGYQHVARALEEGLIDVVIAADLLTPEDDWVAPEETLLTAMRKMNLRGVDLLPVLSGRPPNQLLGVLSRADIMQAYQARLLLEE